MSEKKKFNRPAGIPPRDKQSHAQYVWIKQMFLRLDEIDIQLKTLNESIEELNKQIIEVRKRVTILENRNIYKEEEQQSSKGEPHEKDMV